MPSVSLSRSRIITTVNSLLTMLCRTKMSASTEAIGANYIIVFKLVLLSCKRMDAIRSNLNENYRQTIKQISYKCKNALKIKKKNDLKKQNNVLITNKNVK